MHIEEQPRHLESLDEVRKVDNKTEADEDVGIKNKLVSEVRTSHPSGIEDIKTNTDNNDLRLPLMLQDTKNILRA
jgi:hypothetical protein